MIIFAFRPMPIVTFACLAGTFVRLIMFGFFAIIMARLRQIGAMCPITMLIAITFALVIALPRVSGITFMFPPAFLMNGAMCPFAMLIAITFALVIA